MADVKTTLQDAFRSGVAEFAVAAEAYVAEFRNWMKAIDWNGTGNLSKGMPNPRNPKRIQPEERRTRLLNFRSRMRHVKPLAFRRPLQRNSPLGEGGDQQPASQGQNRDGQASQ